MSDTTAPPPDNAEWRLADLVDAIAAEIDRTHDTLSLKSYGRGLVLGLKGLELDLAVNARVGAGGQVFFRTVEAAKPSASILKLTFEEVVQTQLEEVRTPLDAGATGWPLATLQEITPAEISALQSLSIFTVDDLGRYTRTPALLATLARQSGIKETRLRGWVGAPFLTRIVPPEVAPGENARIEGGDLGAQPGEGDAVLFHGISAEVVAWSASALTVKVPVGATGPVYATIGGTITNHLAWTARAGPSLPDLALTGVAPASGQAGSSLSVVLSGSAFASGMTVTFGEGIEIQGFIVKAADRATAAIAIADNAAPGRRDVTLTGPGYTSSATLPAGFTITEAPPPSGLTISGVDPGRAPAGTTQRVTISGSGFLPGLTAAFGTGIKTAVESVTPTQVLATLTISRQAAAGGRAVRVTNPGGPTAALKAGFKVVAPQP